MWNKIKLLMSSSWTWAQPYILSALKVITKELLIAAAGVVSEVASKKGLTDRQRRELAEDLLKERMSTYKDQAINLAIELVIPKAKQDNLIK